MNRYASHLYVIPEDDRNRQIAQGFVNYHEVVKVQIKVMPPAGGWPNVLKTFADEYIKPLRNNPLAHVVMLIDFDDQVVNRGAKFKEAIPPDLQDRVFVVGSKYTPEKLKKSLKIDFEKIGESLARDCHTDTTEIWNHEQLQHNDAERRRLIQIVKSC